MRITGWLAPGAQVDGMADSPSCSMLHADSCARPVREALRAGLVQESLRLERGENAQLQVKVEEAQARTAEVELEPGAADTDLGQEEQRVLLPMRTHHIPDSLCTALNELIEVEVCCD